MTIVLHLLICQTPRAGTMIMTIGAYKEYAPCYFTGNIQKWTYIHQNTVF